MGTKSKSAVRKEVRAGKLVLVIDFRFRDTKGAERRYRRDASVQTMAAARAEAERLYQQAITTGDLTLTPKAKSLSDFVEGRFTELILPKFRPSTRVRYLSLFGQGLLDSLGRVPLDEIDTLKIRQFGATILEREIQVRAHVNLLRTVMSAAVELGELAVMPVFPKAAARGRKLPDAPSDEEVAQLLAHADDWLRPAMGLAAYAGLRMGEVRALEVQDVDFAAARITVRRALSEDVVMSPKSGHERIVPLIPELAQLLRDAMRDKLPRTRVVLTTAGTTPTRQGMLSRVKALQARHGLRGRSFHALRHFFCSALVRRGASIEAVRQLAGHSGIAVTQQYVHATGSELVSTMAKLSGN